MSELRTEHRDTQRIKRYALVFSNGDESAWSYDNLAEAKREAKQRMTKIIVRTYTMSTKEVIDP